ncbi:NUDIX domain-containing protein [Devosia sp. MC532]|uniref:NUDIX hydrolase n=1 Tax=Devosia sp. MC532 TaxID=2799788 RepID=UPI0018F7911E|nr:NUDIX domain-containing protein [Devosia sp. MC532]MBJ7577767.1 NUDIX domain-containing protein [Devosia sp. MC532]
MMSSETFHAHLSAVVTRYRADVAEPGEHLALLRWQMDNNHRLDLRDTFPGHITTSALVISPAKDKILLIDHVTIGRWLQPGGHYEPSDSFWASALREAVEETGVFGAALHPWHKGDLPLVIDSHDVPGKPARDEPPHVHHDLQYVFVASADQPLTAQLDEVHAAQWQDFSALTAISARAAKRILAL